MENRFEHNEPEEQNWKKYLPPVNPLETGRQQWRQNVRQDALCAWVCEKLSDLLDNDGSVRPEQAAGIYAHLAVCRGCAQEWDDMQRVVGLVESLPPAELPRDFSRLIMQRIENQDAPLARHALVPQPVSEAVVQTFETSASKMKVTPAQTVEQKTATLTAQQTLTVGQTQQTHTQQTQTRSELLQRMMAGGILSSVLAYFLSTTWGRQMLGANLMTASAWLSQTADTLRGVPVLTWVVGLIFSSLAQLDAMLSHTYHAMGAAVAVGLSLDVAVCVFAYAYLNARRRNAQFNL